MSARRTSRPRPQAGPRRRARLYVRISKDMRERLRGEPVAVATARQERDLREFADRELGADVVAVYRDDDISASQYARKARPDFTRMLRECEVGDLVVAVAWDRLSRNGSVPEALLDVVLERDVEVWTKRAGRYDFTTATGKRQARQAAVDAAYESDTISERTCDAKAYDAEDGRLLSGGSIPFGYVRGVHPGHGKATLIPDEAHSAPIVRTAVRRIREGANVSQVLREHPEWLNRSGTARLRVSHLCHALHAVAIAGYVEHKGERFPAEWLEDALITLEEFDEVQEAMARNTKQRTGGESGGKRFPKSFVSGVLTNEDGVRLKVTGGQRLTGRTVRYFAAPGVAIAVGEAERLLEEHVLRFTDRAVLRLEEEEAPATSAVLEVARLEARLAELARREELPVEDDDYLDPVEYRAKVGALRPQLAAAREAAKAQARRRVRPVAVASYLGTKGRLRDVWPELDTAQRREVLEFVYDRIVVRGIRDPRVKAGEVPAIEWHVREEWLEDED